MGRKRVSRGKTREPVTISLPRDLIIQFDQTLGDFTRSRRIESMIVNYLRNNQAKIHDFARHHYECLDCNRQMTMNRYLDPILMVCRSKVGGCDGVNIRYLGILDEGEEE